MVKRLNGAWSVLGGAVMTMLAMSLMMPAGSTQAGDSRATSEKVEERMARVEKGLEPVSVGKDGYSSIWPG